MRSQTSLFSTLMQHLPMAHFDRAVTRHKANKGVRSLTARSHLGAMVIGQLTGAQGLRDVEAAAAAEAGELRRLRMLPAARSTLADANASRAPEVFEALIAPLHAKLSPTQQRKVRDEVRILDSTRVLPGAGAGDWARFAAAHVAAKVHVVYDPAREAPLFFEVSSGNVNDISIAKHKLSIMAGASYVFDLGYYDFGFWAELDALGCRFVTRVKKNTVLTAVEDRPVATGSAIVSDRIVTLPSRLAASRANPFAKPGRAITVTLETQRRITLFTNDLDSPAQEIADLYKARWKIELFFRWLKQNLRIRHFLGTSRNAVRIQIAVAIIVYMVLRFLHKASSTAKSFTTFARNFGHCLFKTTSLPRHIERLETVLRRPILNSNQLTFEL
jgi:IS4 transposase